MVSGSVLPRTGMGAGEEQGENECWMDTSRSANSPSFGNWGISNPSCYEPVTTAPGCCKALINSVLLTNTSSLGKNLS